MKRNDTDVKFLPTLATACCVLHNICEINGDEFDEDWFVSEAATVPTANQAAASATTMPSGERIRNTLCDYFGTIYSNS